MDKLSYSFGLAIASQLAELGADKISVDDFAQALKDIFAGKDAQIDPMEAQQLVNEFLHNAETQRRQAQEAKGAQAKKEGEEFLQANAKKDGIIVTASGLQYQVLKEGTGKAPSAADSVKCHYEGTLIDGTVFDSSYRRNEPAVFGLRQVISGWTEGLQLMKEGAKYRFFIPYNLAYGAQGAGGSIPPYAALIFDVELIQVM